MYDDEEEEVVEKIKIPKYKILYSELETFKKEQPADATNNQNNANNTEKITNNASNNDFSKSKEEAKNATTSLEGCEFDKDIATKLKKKLDDDPEMNNPSVSNAEKNIDEFGVWQVIVGRQYVASVTFDAKYLIYFVFEELGKYFLVFRS